MLEEAKEGGDFVSSESKVIDYISRVLDFMAGVADQLRTRFAFKTSERTNSALFSTWIVRQVNISLNEAVSQMSEDLLASERRMIMLHKRLLVAAGNFDVKGLSVGFIIEEFFSR